MQTNIELIILFPYLPYMQLYITCMYVLKCTLVAMYVAVYYSCRIISSHGKLALVRSYVHIARWHIRGCSGTIISLCQCCYRICASIVYVVSQLWFG